jgi:hypothetical protein
MQDENNKSKNKSREDLTDDAYLRRYLRKPVTVYVRFLFFQVRF